MRRLFGARRGQLLFRKPTAGGLPEITRITMPALGLNDIDSMNLPATNDGYSPEQNRIVYFEVTAFPANDDYVGLDGGNPQIWSFSVDGARPPDPYNIEITTGMSNNDVALAIANALGGTEDGNFALVDMGAQNMFANYTDSPVINVGISQEYSPGSPPAIQADSSFITFGVMVYSAGSWANTLGGVYYRVNGSGTDPSGLGLFAVNLDEADSGDVVASKTLTVITANYGTWITTTQPGGGSVLTLTQKEAGVVSEIEAFGFNQTVDISHSQVGSAANVHNRNSYILLNRPAAAAGYYIWFNIESGGVDPAIAGRTGIQVTTLSWGTIAATLVIAIRLAINATAPLSFSATNSGNFFTVTNVVSGAVTDATSSGITGITILVTQQGS